MRPTTLSLVIAVGLTASCLALPAAAQDVPGGGTAVYPGSTTPWPTYPNLSPWQGYNPASGWTGYAPPAVSVPPTVATTPSGVVAPTAPPTVATTPYGGVAPTAPPPAVASYQPQTGYTTRYGRPPIQVGTGVTAPSLYREPGSGRNVYLYKPWLR